MRSLQFIRGASGIGARRFEVESVTEGQSAFTLPWTPADPLKVVARLGSGFYVSGIHFFVTGAQVSWIGPTLHAAAVNDPGDKLTFFA